jgi:hypothetical protein
MRTSILYCYRKKSDGSYVLLDQDGVELANYDIIEDVAQFFTEESGGVEPTYYDLPSNFNPLDVFEPLNSSELEELNDLIAVIKNSDNGFSVNEMTDGEYGENLD